MGDRAVGHAPSLRESAVGIRHEYHGGVSHPPVAWDVDSPVEADVSVVWFVALHAPAPGDAAGG
jgi:hypothetical protein